MHIETTETPFFTYNIGKGQTVWLYILLERLSANHSPHSWAVRESFLERVFEHYMSLSTTADHAIIYREVKWVRK